MFKKTNNKGEEKMIRKVFLAMTAILMVAMGLIGCATTNSVHYSSFGARGNVPDISGLEAGSSVTLPEGDALSFGDAVFVGWVQDNDTTETILPSGSSFTPTTKRTTFYPSWKYDVPTIEEAHGLNNKLVWIYLNAVSGGNYVIEIDSDEAILPHLIGGRNRTDINVTLKGVGGNRTITYFDPSSTGGYPLFAVAVGSTLILDENITIAGFEYNRDPLIRVGGKLVMNNECVITRNGYGGVFLGHIGSFQQGTIGRGEFEMNGGSIVGNKGGGVTIYHGLFTMNNGSITDNTTEYSGGGVSVGNGFATFRAEFVMNGGEIKRNSAIGSGAADLATGNARGYGGGIALAHNGRFTMNGGIVADNSASHEARNLFRYAPNAMSLRENIFINGGTQQDN